MKKVFVFIAVLILLTTLILACSKGGAPSAPEAQKSTKKVKDLRKEINGDLERAGKEIDRETRAIQKAKKMSAREAFKIAEPAARNWNPEAQLVSIISGPDINETGGSGYWEFRYQWPTREKGIYTVIVRDGVLDAEHTKEGTLKWKAPKIPDGWIDSKDAYNQSVEKFKAGHSDFASYSPFSLSLSSGGMSSAKPCWVMNFYLPRNTPNGAKIDPETGEYLGDVKK